MPVETPNFEQILVTQSNYVLQYPNDERNGMDTQFSLIADVGIPQSVIAISEYQLVTDAGAAQIPLNDFLLVPDAGVNNPLIDQFALVETIDQSLFPQIENGLNLVSDDFVKSNDDFALIVSDDFRNIDDNFALIVSDDFRNIDDNFALIVADDFRVLISDAPFVTPSDDDDNDTGKTLQQELLFGLVRSCVPFERYNANIRAKN